jgi:hypothetical protein
MSLLGPMQHADRLVTGDFSPGRMGWLAKWTAFPYRVETELPHLYTLLP